MTQDLPAFDSVSLGRRIAASGRPLTAACYANSQTRVATYLPLARAIARAGHASFLLLTPEVNTEKNLQSRDLEGYLDVDGLVIGTLGVHDIPNVEGVDVFFSSEVLGAAPRGSRTVRVIHSLPDGKLSINYAARVRKHSHLARTTDYLAIPIRQSSRAWTIENYAAGIDGPLPAIEPSRRDHFDIVPAGYPKIEYLAEAIPKDAPRRNLVFCPTVTTVPHSRVRSHGIAILQALLKNFPTHNVVFRPYPKSNEPDFANLLKAFRHDPLFIHDRTLSGLEYLREAAAAITDRSSAAVTFSMATGRPSVFFEDGIPAPSAADDPLGYRATSIDQIVASVRLALDHAEEWHSRIMEERGRYLYRPGTTSDYLAEKIPVFASGESDSEWLSIPRLQLYSGILK